MHYANLIKTLLTLLILSQLAACSSQIKNAVSETIKIYGNCEKCEKTIENSGNVAKIAQVDWDKDTKMAMLTYDSNQTNRDEILKRIALAGYDSDFFLAPDDVYAKLPSCCHYERAAKAATSTTVATETTTPEVENTPEQNPPPQTTAGAVDHTQHQKPLPQEPKKQEQPKPQESQQSKPQEKPKSQQPQQPQHTTTTSQPVAEESKKPQLVQVFNQYFALKNALVDTDAQAAAQKATQLSSAIKEVKMELLPTQEHMAWMKVWNALSANANKIAQSSDIAKQRDTFMSLSNDMYQLIKVSEQTKPVYYQFCPMANDGKGANWLSQESEVRNPYYGSQMLNCGKVVETIK